MAGPLYGDPVNWGHPLNRGLVSWWLGLPGTGGGATLFDLVRQPGYNGTLTNGPTRAPMPNGFGGLTFDGANDYVSVPSAGNFTTSDFSASFWVRRDGDSSSGSVFIYKGLFNTNGWFIQSENSTGRYLKLVTNQSGANQQTYVGSEKLVAGVWSHVVVTRAGASARIYVNGLDVTGTTGSHVNPASSSDALQFGQYGTTATTFSWVGAGGDFRLYSRALSASEAWLLYEEGRRGLPNLLRRAPRRAWLTGVPAAPGGFKAAWARGANVLIGAGRA